ncbi:MAG TPA: DUF5829 family protein [Umezawaea sp.]|nr:DUF5829 family protein [Umezawaea sp.]
MAAVAPALLGGGRGRQRLLFYNHSYGVPERETADAVEHSAYLAVSTESAGDPGAVVDRLHDQGVPDPVRFRQTRDFGDGVAVPWFEAVYTTAQYDAFGAWSMEYLPENFADPRGGTEPADHPGDVGRERHLSDDYRAHLARDVTGVRLAVTEHDLASTVPLLRAGGYAVRHTRGGAVAWCGGTTIRFDVVPRDRAGLRRVDFTLNPVRAAPRGPDRPVHPRRRPRHGRRVDVRRHGRPRPAGPSTGAGTSLCDRVILGRTAWLTPNLHRPPPARSSTEAKGQLVSGRCPGLSGLGRGGRWGTPFEARKARRDGEQELQAQGACPRGPNRRVLHRRAPALPTDSTRRRHVGDENPAAGGGADPPAPGPR